METSNTRFNLTFVLSRKLLKAVAAVAAPFLMQLSCQLCLAITRRQRRKCRLSEC